MSALRSKADIANHWFIHRDARKSLGSLVRRLRVTVFR